MSNLKISLRILIPEIVLGESLWAEVIMENVGTDSIEVPSPEYGADFEYLFRRTDIDPPLQFKVSARNAIHMKTMDTMPEPPIEKVPLKPGERFSYREDLTPSIIPAPSVGAYNIQVIYNAADGQIMSAAASVAIVLPRIVKLSAAIGPKVQKLVSVYALQGNQGQYSIFQRESDEENPAEGLDFRRIDTQPASAGPQVATTVELDDNPSGRWFAWLEEKGLGAGVAQEATLFAQVPPTAVGLKTPRLYPVGWQPSGESAIFLVLGTDPQGRVALTAITFEAVGTAAVRTVALAAAKPPTHWAARLAGMDPDPVFDVVWAEAGPGRTWLFKQSVTPKTGQAGAVQALCEHSEALAAISLYPIKGNTADVVDLIYGPSKENTPFNFLRLPLTGGKPVLDIDIALPQRDPPVLPREWALAAKPLENPAALALLDNKVMLLRMAPQPQWQVLTQETRQAGHIHLEVVGDDILWAIWADAQLGMNYQHIP